MPWLCMEPRHQPGHQQICHWPFFLLEYSSLSSKRVDVLCFCVEQICISWLIIHYSSCIIALLARISCPVFRLYHCQLCWRYHSLPLRQQYSKSCLYMTWWCHKSVHQWQHSSHLKALLPLTEGLLILSYYMSRRTGLSFQSFMSQRSVTRWYNSNN